jgi:hypothetical protein
MNNEKEFFISLGIRDEYIDIQTTIGKIEFLDTFEGKMVLEAMKRGRDITIKPCGYETMDENGNIKEFTLTGFTIV